MAVSDAHKRASKKWNESRDQITIRPAVEVGAAIRLASVQAGYDSIQKYILAALDAFGAFGPGGLASVRPAAETGKKEGKTNDTE